MMIFRVLLFWLLIAPMALATAPDASAAEPRTALVIGNSRYAFSPLPNPANDATDVAAALRDAGFDVILKIDADRGAMTEAIGAFGKTLKTNRAMGLFYYAGHGAQIGGENYLVPVGDSFASERDLTERAVKATDIVDAMARRGMISTSSSSTPAATMASARRARAACRASTAMRGFSCPTRPHRERWRRMARAATALTPST